MTPGIPPVRADEAGEVALGDEIMVHDRDLADAEMHELLDYV